MIRAVLLLAACAPETSDSLGIASAKVYTYTYEADIQPIWDANCVNCHAGSGAAEGLDLTGGISYGMLVNVPSVQVPTMDRVEPGSASTSYLYHKLAGSQATVGGYGSRMPQGRPQLSAATRAIITTWITEGAPYEETATTLTVNDLIPGDLAITEIHVNPAAVGDLRGEYFEVRNDSGSAVVLTGLVITDDGGQSVTVTATTEFAAGEAMLFAANGNALMNGGLTEDITYTGFTLDNAGDEIVLSNASGELDRVAFATSSGWTIPDGASLNLDPTIANPASDNDSAASWCASTTTYGSGDEGTPGSANDACSAPDADGDGYDTTTDCDDANPSVNPGATDIPDNGIDEDCSGADATAILTVPEMLPGDLILTEIHFNPGAVSENRGEWFEFYNASGMTVSLDGLVIQEMNQSFTISSSATYPPGDFIVLAGNGSATFNGGVTEDYVWPSGGWTFSSVFDNVELNNGTTLDNVAYDSATGWPMVEGASITLDMDFADPTLNDDMAYWCLGTSTFGAGDFGTPGSTNDDCGIPVDTTLTVADLLEGDLVVTEIMKDPNAVFDANGEWFEIWNASGSEIDLDGLVVSDASPVTSFTVAGSLLLADGDYLVFALSGNTSTNGGVTAGYDYNSWTLANNDDEVILSNGTLTIDQVYYDNAVTFPDPVGASLSLSPAATDATSNDAGANWCVGTSTYGSGDVGTPGSPNDGC